MKKAVSLFPALLIISISLTAQITVDQNDFANAGKTVYLANGQNNPFLNITATGPNSTWDFSTLRSTGQQQIDYLNVNTTGIIYALYYANISFNPNRANIALTGTDIPLNQALGLTNQFTFYYKNSSMYKKVGYGGDIIGLPVPIVMSTPDTVYRFPMDFGNASTSNSDYTAGLPGVLTSIYSQRRVTTIDGWGTLIIPYGTFDVLRSKSEVFGNDSVYVDSLGFGVNIPRTKITEYKWIAKNEDVPLLQINTSSIFGIEIINLILFKDNPLSIVIDSTNSTYCPGSGMSVHYTATGTFNTSGFLQQGNRFTVQLSNSSGTFTGSVNIGNVTSTTSGTVAATIPNSTASGTGYMIRIISNSPVDTSAAFGPFTIYPIPTAAITINGNTALCTDDSVHLAANSGIGFSYQWQLDSMDISGATAQAYTTAAAGDYTVAVSNVCGTATSLGVTIAVNPEPVHTITAASSYTCDGSPISITAFNTSGVSPVTYQWYESGSPVAGATDSTFIATATGNYSLVVTDRDGCIFDTDSLQIDIDSLSAPVINFTGNPSFCTGGDVTLWTDTTSPYAYQWQLNGADIIGATDYFYVAAETGNYAVMISDSCDSAISLPITVMENAIPQHSITASSTLSCAGTPVTIVASNMSGDTALTFQWFEGGDSIPGATDTLLTVTEIGNYSLAVTASMGCTFQSDTVTIVFDSLAAPLVYAGTSTSFCSGDSVVLTTDTNSNYSYQWLVDGASISGATTSEYIAKYGGNYAVKITIGNGCNATSGIKKVNVYPLPPVSVITQNGDTLTGTPAIGYQWYLDGILIPDADAQSYRPVEDGSYTLEITDAAGCSNVSAPYDVTGTGVATSTIAGWQLGIKPNPISGSAFSVWSSVLISEVQVFNAAGVLVYQNHLDSPSGNLLINDDLRPQGIYLLKVKTSAGERVLKLVRM